jgi:hypothetical protein
LAFATFGSQLLFAMKREPLDGKMREATRGICLRDHLTTGGILTFYGF